MKRRLIEFRRPSIGRPYVRCKDCNRQIFADVAKSATSIQISFQLNQRVKDHREKEHS